jgi:hypothetical protein
MHSSKYLNGQPIYNYEHGKMEGGDRGRYNGGVGYDPYNPNENFVGCQDCNEMNVVEGFEGCSSGSCNLVEGFNGIDFDYNLSRRRDWIIFIFLVIFLGILVYYFFVVRR